MGTDNLSILVVDDSEFELAVNMPGMDGYEVCQKIRETDKLVKIIFVSGSDSTQDILHGYDVGANDYIVKPYSRDILLSKAEQSVKRSLEFVAMSQKAECLAMEAMTSLGEMGAVVSFLKASFRAPDIDALAELIFCFLHRFKLHASLQLRTECQVKNYSSLGTLKPIEEDLLSRVACADDRIVERGQRMIINYDNASLLVKNMPVDDEFKMGRYRDNLTLMLEGADEKLSLLTMEEEARGALDSIRTLHQQIKAENDAFMSKTIYQIEHAFASLGMTEDQEQNLIGLIERSQSDYEKSATDARLIESKITTILNKIETKIERGISSNSDSVMFM